MSRFPWKRLLVVGAALVILYVVLVPFRLGDVTVPAPRPVRVQKALNAAQGWNDDQARWYHHASQGTRILPLKWFLSLEQPTIVPSGKIVEGGYLQRFGFLPDEKSEANPYNPYGLPIGFAIERGFHAPWADPPSKEPEDVVGLTCAACHTGQITYRKEGELVGVRVEGGSAMINLAAFQEAIGRAIAYTLMLDLDPRFERFARGVLGDDDVKDAAKKEALRAGLQHYLDVGLKTKEYARVHKLNGVDGGFGRTDALGLIGNRVFSALEEANQIVTDAPVNFPPLWDTPWFTWVQYNASIRMPMVRNIGEALGVGAPVNLDERKGPLYASTVNVANLHAMEDQLGGHQELTGLRPPKWTDTDLPPLDSVASRGRTRRGEALYGTYCLGCHLPPMPEIVEDAARRTPRHPGLWETDPASKKRLLKLVECDLHEIGTDENQAMNLYRRVAVFRGKTIPAAQGLFAVTEFIRRDKYRALDLTCAQVDQYNRYRTFDEGTYQEVEGGKFIRQVLVANLKYKARPLDGIWATPPFLHNGSVPNLYQMLVPVDRRSKSFYLGTTEFDPVSVGYRTEQFPGAFLLDTSLPGNGNAGHEFRNLTLDELERVPEIASGAAVADAARPLDQSRRWARVLDIAPEDYSGLSAEQRWEKVREATRRALRVDRVRREHPFRGVLGPELTEQERWDLVEYLKSL